MFKGYFIKEELVSTDENIRVWEYNKIIVKKVVALYKPKYKVTFLVEVKNNKPLKKNKSKEDKRDIYFLKAHE